MKNKRGELTTKQLVTIIILVVSFTVILILLFRLNLGEVSNKEICHNSVLMKAQSTLGSGPLDCKTNYVCISGGGDCKGFNEDYKLEAKTEKEIKNIIKNETADCEWMFSDGEFGWLDGKNHCAICSIIKFNSDTKNFNMDGVDISTDKRYTIYIIINPDLGKDQISKPKIILSSEIGDEKKSKCNVFDLTKA